MAADGYGVLLGFAAAGANRRGAPLLAPALGAAAGQLGGALPADRACRLGAGYDGGPARRFLAELGFAGQIAACGVPAAI